MGQSGSTVSLPASSSTMVGQIGYSGCAGVASMRNVTLPPGRPVSRKLPAESDRVWLASTLTRTPAMPCPSGVTKRPLTPVTPTADCTLRVTWAERVCSTPDTSAVPEIATVAGPVCALDAAVRMRLPAWPSARFAGLNLALTPDGRPDAPRLASPVKFCAPRLDRLRLKTAWLPVSRT